MGSKRSPSSPKKILGIALLINDDGLLTQSFAKMEEMETLTFVHVLGMQKAVLQDTC